MVLSCQFQLLAVKLVYLQSILLFFIHSISKDFPGSLCFLFSSYHLFASHQLPSANFVCDHSLCVTVISIDFAFLLLLTCSITFWLLLLGILAPLLRVVRSMSHSSLLLVLPGLFHPWATLLGCWSCHLTDLHRQLMTILFSVFCSFSPLGLAPSLTVSLLSSHSISQSCSSV